MFEKFSCKFNFKKIADHKLICGNGEILIIKLFSSGESLLKSCNPRNTLLLTGKTKSPFSVICFSHCHFFQRIKKGEIYWWIHILCSFFYFLFLLWKIRVFTILLWNVIRSFCRNRSKLGGFNSVYVGSNYRHKLTVARSQISSNISQKNSLCWPLFKNYKWTYTCLLHKPIFSCIWPKMSENNEFIQWSSCWL